MDNFEYSIQLSDRDWEEFYSTAEECSLMQVTLATEEDLLLSDTEREDVTCSTASSKTKFIRVSLCPPVGDRREPQTMQVALSPPRHSAYKWIGSSDDVLSGSEDEEEFGSVARFLCQKETLFSQKGDTEHRTDIPSSKTKDNYIANITVEKSLDSPVNESIVEYMRSLNTSRKYHYEREKEDTHSKSTKTINPYVTSNGESERGHTEDRNNISVASNDPSKTTAPSLYSKDSPDIVNDHQSCSMVQGPCLPECLLNENIPGIISTTQHDKKCDLQSLTSLQVSLGKYDQLIPENKMNDSIKNSAIDSVDSIVSTNSLLHGDVMENNIQDYTLQFTSKALEDSSAVQQNIPTPLVENLDLPKNNPSTQEGDIKVPVGSHELSFDPYRLPRVECTIPLNSLVPPTNYGHNESSSSLPVGHQPSSYRSTALTLPEMYDFFFDDVSESGIVETATNMASQEATQECRLPRAEGTIPIPSLVPDTISAQSVSSSSLPTQHQSPSYGSSSLTLPEMYDFFFDDGTVENPTNMASQEPKQEAMVYTPDMYEYFFVEENENTIKIKDHNSEEPSANVEQASLPSAVASWPEACEFFFADGPQHQDRQGILFSVPSSQTQSSTNIFQSIFPKGLQEITPKRAFQNRDGKFVPHENHGTSDETPSTVLLANIGAVSAIRYLRRRRRTWQGPTLEPLEET
ncbi:PGC-1 and ERR-induced regulator in muscle protein 1 isoform X2 [Pyxicephalus adspersus]|uniref:PGC-1 and ERR-induced regulator in muscle protein 1 isoform X2 n=1 Tax=Pyxicephalus adspersus TaxID=30357 RepID=UPI003B5BC178